ncbi:class I SAM-dependent methyltransferase [Sulfurihydrogenibium subterraneum]|uniref:class I SAM-dependent methyltransferase n=1 Tax=Sulfurihydrogenibium subterraneum TaxID=171121 RepID=UPI00048F2D78|nr:class I SAM-dependent methyltransferase [Sulfurihydrogenibium subterraneum]
MLEFTGERYIPDLKEAQISYEHWHRYLYASYFAKDKVVLDIACGEGYGSDFLSNYANKVIGVDIDKNSINHAKSKYKKENLEFMTGSVSNIPIEGSKIFDVIVSFETIEHVDEETQSMFIQEVKRLLKEDGIFIVSTPNKEVYTDKTGFKNPFHIKEFYIDEFKEFLKTYFKNVKLLGQKVYPVSYIWDMEEKNNTLKEYKIELNENGFRPTNKPKEVLLVIAICSDQEILENHNSILVDLNETLTTKLIKEYLDLLHRLDLERKVINKLNEKIAFLENKINRLAEKIRQKKKDDRE